MRIISKYHDFYDTIVSYGIDKACIYLRNELILPGDFEIPDTRWGRWPHQEEFVKMKAGVATRYRVNKYVIGFCGNLYPVIVVDKERTDKKERFFFYSAEKTSTFFAKEKVSFESHWGYLSDRGFTVKSDQSLKNFFEGTDFVKLKDNFYKHKSPVFIYGKFAINGELTKNPKERLILNPKLKDYRFVQVKEPPVAWQELYMFLSGVLGIQTPPMVKIDDKKLAAKRGHDSRYSFRKPPGKRGKPKWR